MAEEELGARLKLKGRKQFSDDADKAAKDLKNVGDKADRADKAGRRMGGGLGIGGKALSGLSSAAKVGGIAIAATTTALVAFGVQGFNSLKRIEVIGAQTNAVLWSTGGVANVTKLEIDGLAGSLEAVTGVEAESITEGQNLLLTFTKLRNEVGEGNDIFDRATVAMVDMSTALGTDAASSALQLGKALNDPIKGVGALSRAGVSFTEEQKQQIKTMQESGDMLGAQKMIMSELETQFGGSAEMYGKTTQGLTDRTGHLFGTLQESIVTEFTPGVNGGIQKVHDKLEELVESSADWLPAMGEKFRGVTSAVWEVGSSFLEVFKTGGLTGVTSELDDMLGTGDLLTSTVEALESIFESLGKIWKGLVLPVLKQFNELIPEGVRPIELFASGLEWIADNGELLQPILAGMLAGFIAFKVVTTILKTITAAQAALNLVMSMNPIGLVVIAIAALAAGLIYAWNNSETFRDIVTGAFNKVKDVVMGVWNWVSDNWPLLLAILTGPFGLAVLAIVRNWGTIKRGVTGVKDWIVDKFDAIVTFFTKLPGRISNAVTGMFDGVKDAFKGAVNWIIDGWNGLSLTFPEINTRIPGVGKVGGWTWDTPDLERLHSGGTTTSDGFVNMKPGEEVVFLPQAASVVPMSDNVKNMAASVSGGGGSDGPTILQVVLDGKVLAEAVYDHTGDKVARK